MGLVVGKILNCEGVNWDSKITRVTCESEKLSFAC